VPSDTLGAFSTPEAPVSVSSFRSEEAHVSQRFDNPSPDELRAFTEDMPETRLSGFGNVNVQTTVLSRSA